MERILINIIPQVLPKHLWVVDRRIFHIDQPPANLYPSDKYEGHYKVVEVSIGYLCFSNCYDREIKIDLIEVIFNRLINSSKSFHSFLRDVGGNAELYEELIILNTGGNIWRS